MYLASVMLKYNAGIFGIEYMFMLNIIASITVNLYAHSRGDCRQVICEMRQMDVCAAMHACVLLGNINFV